MKANKSLVLLAFAFAAGWLFARPVSVQEASYAASAWARAGEALGVALGSEIDSARIKTFSAANDAKVYAVPFVGGGIVFTTSDTRMEPVIGFSKSSSVDLDDSGALASLLKNDVRLRAKLLEAIEKDRNAQSGNPAAVSATLDDGRWASLLAGFGSSGGASGMTAADSADPLSSISSMRVSPIVKTKWSQQKAGGINCYNYYTPNNYPCGCTATAAAQVMRYFSYPDGEVASRNFICSVDGVDRSLSLMGGLYDWEKMVYAPADGVNEEVAKEIGKLTYDLGVALGSEYADAATGALPYDVAKTFRNVFGYANAYSYWNEDTLSSGKGGLHNLGLRERIIYANLDARKPVQLAIYGYNRLGEWGGHAVVADGYGYHNVDGVETAFVHINMGWGGVDDLWYNIPEIDAANTGSYYASTATTYSYMGGATFNVDAAETGLEIFSGRVLDAYGEPAANAVVKLQGDNGYSAVTTADDKGIYSFAVPGGAKYVATTSTDDGKYVAATDEVLVRKSVGDGSYMIVLDSAVGNAWGNELKLDEPVVEVAGVGYATLESAFAAAKALPGPVVIGVTKPLEFKSAITVDFSAVICSAETDASLTPVGRTGEAMFNVAAGGEIVFSNIVFAAGTSTVVSVAEGGLAAVAGEVDFALSDESIAAVRTVAADGFAILGELKHGFALDCRASLNIPGVFGAVYNLDKDAAGKAAAFVANFNDDTGEVRGSIEGDAAPFVLKWGEQAVPVEASACYLVGTDGITNTSARISRLFARLGGTLSGGELVVRKSAELSSSLAIDGDVTIRGEDGVELEMVEPEDGFVNAFEVAGGVLTVSNITFRNFKGESLFNVNGGSLELQAGAVIDRAVGTSYHSGAIAVMSGTATIGEGAKIVGCHISYPYGGGCGGAAYVNRGALLNLFGCTITGCKGSVAGGVYADRGATVNLKGDLTVDGNFTDYGIPSDVYAVSSTAKINVLGAVKGSVGVSYGSAGNLAGQVFATLPSGLGNAELAAIARDAKSFFNDKNTSLRGVLSADKTSLVWSAVIDEVPGDLQSWAVAKVVMPAGAELYYWSAAEAIKSATNAEASVQLILSDAIDESLGLPASRITITSVPGSTNTLSGGVLSVARSKELKLADIMLDGDGILDIDGGSVVLGGMVGGNIGTSGGTKADTNLFGRVEADLDYDTLTNSAACFVNAELAAYGVAITNSTQTKLAWSTAIAADGSYTDPNGDVWYCVGDVPENEVEIDPVPIAFSALRYDSALGEYTLVVTNLVAGCWYSLYATNSLAGGFVIDPEVTPPVTNFQAEVDGEFELVVPQSDSSMFWKMTGESGTIRK